MDILQSDIKPAPYNPRRISDEELRGLKTSMGKFGDISGITFNKRTGQLVTGHHRWSLLSDEHDDLTFEKAQDNLYAINSPKGFTGYLIRIVDWDKSVEKAANIAANSQQLSGKFIPELLSQVLEEVQIDFPELITDLRFDVLATQEIPQKLPVKDYETGMEIDTGNFGNDLQHTCPKCGFEFNG